jgi:hypothetical protein
MNGHYLIPLEPNQAPEDNPRVRKLLSALAPGAEYTVEIQEGQAPTHRPDWKRFAEIRATGGEERKKPPKFSVPATPPILTREQCSKPLAGAERSERIARVRLRANLRRQWLGETTSEWERSHARDRASEHAMRKTVGSVVGLLIARRHGRRFRPYEVDYRELDSALGIRVKRLSELNSYQRDEGYLAFIVREYAGGNLERLRRTAAAVEEPIKFRPIDDYRVAKADVEYWRELERLAGQREELRGRRRDSAGAGAGVIAGTGSGAGEAVLDQAANDTEAK